MPKYGVNCQLDPTYVGAAARYPSQLRIENQYVRGVTVRGNMSRGVANVFDLENDDLDVNDNELNNLDSGRRNVVPAVSVWNGGTNTGQVHGIRGVTPTQRESNVESDPDESVVDVLVQGEVKMVAGGTVTKGQYVTCYTSSGLIINSNLYGGATAGEPGGICGIALASGTAGDLIPVLFCGKWPAFDAIGTT